MPKFLYVTTLFSILLFIVNINGGLCLVVRLASWNLLAPEYAQPRKYPWCHVDHLDWEYRKGLIVPQLMAMDADIICLQEVQIDLWPDFLSSLQPLGYDGVAQDVKGGHNVASALLIRKTCPLQLERIESRSRVLLTVLRDSSNNNNNKLLYLCSVHLEAGESHDNNLQRYHQLKSLFKRLTYHCRLDKTSLDDAYIVLAGDFNMLRTNPLHTFLSQGLLYNPQQMKTKPPTSIIQLKDAYLDFSTADDEGSSSLQPKKSKRHYSTKEVEDEEPQQQQQLGMTYAKGYVLDYFWTSRKVDVQDTLLLHPRASTTEPQKWPSETHPSDHLPIGVDLDW
jgi:mRNA deadenylase 3'-5' endonuclease subunit Ccr4